MVSFTVRDYSAEEAACALPRVPTHNHPLSSPSSHQVDNADVEKGVFYDPLRAVTADLGISIQDVQYVHNTSIRGHSSEALQLLEKEWAAFKRLLMQKFSSAKTVSISSSSDVILKSGKAYERVLKNTHLEELDDPQKAVEDDIKVISRQEFVSRLHEFKDEISRAWRADDRVTSLKLSIKVAKLLMDTSVLQFYPTLFILVVDILDMVGDLVWERIKRKAEYADDGTVISYLPENFGASDVCSDAKETCNNWFCKIGSIRELLPRIYLELAILHCWRFLQDQSLGCLQRLTMMMRGLADPLASAYCHLYMAHCALKLFPYDIGFLITSITDINILLKRIISVKETNDKNSTKNKKLLISLLEPTIEGIVKCIFKNAYQWKVGDILDEFGLGRNLSKLTENAPFISIVIHHLLKELPAEIVSGNAIEIVQHFECSKDISLDPYLNYSLLGFKLCESRPPVDIIDGLLAKIFQLQVVSQFDDLNEYLKVADAYLEIVLQCQMDKYLSIILDGISKRACNKRVNDDELSSLQSIFMKLITHFNELEDALALNHFVEILDMMYGSSRNMINMCILTEATRNGYISDPTTIQLLFEISQTLHNSMDFSSISDDDHHQPARLISRFVQMVDFGAEMDRHLTFLVECRAAFGSINELKETLVHSSNYLAIRNIKDANKFLGFIKSCIAFNEVTIPSISPCTRQINLFLETAEVSLLGGLVSHTDGLIDSTISCLQDLELTDESQTPIDVDGLLSSARKLCSLLVMVPGNPEQGIAEVPKRILSLVNCLSWKTPKLRVKMLSAILSLSATLSQNKLPYRSDSREVAANDLLFFGEPSYYQELSSISSLVLENLLDGIQQYPNPAARGTLALEACNCIVSSFEASQEISFICTKMIEIAKSCLHANDKYLRSTMNFLGKHLPTVESDITV